MGLSVILLQVDRLGRRRTWPLLPDGGKNICKQHVPKHLLVHDDGLRHGCSFRAVTTAPLGRLFDDKWPNSEFAIKVRLPVGIPARACDSREKHHLLYESFALARSIRVGFFRR